MAQNKPLLKVSVVYALPERYWQQAFQVPLDTTLQQVVQISDFAQHFPDVNLQALALGVYGERSPPERLVADGDRIEIYRPLCFDPMESRRRRAAHRARNAKPR